LVVAGYWRDAYARSWRGRAAHFGCVARNRGHHRSIRPKNERRAARSHFTVTASKKGCPMRRANTEHGSQGAASLLLALLALSGWALVASSWLPKAAAQAPPAGQVVVFQGARLITGLDRPPIDNAVFIVEGGRFGRMGRAADVQVPQGATRVDLTGKT